MYWSWVARKAKTFADPPSSWSDSLMENNRRRSRFQYYFAPNCVWTEHSDTRCTWRHCCLWLLFLFLLSAARTSRGRFLTQTVRSLQYIAWLIFTCTILHMSGFSDSIFCV
jgi:hypothetical protein